VREPYDHKNWWHATVNLLGGLNCKDCDALRSWNDEMADCPANDDDEFLRRCVAVADNAKAEGWTIIESETKFLCPRCTAARQAG
jgi:hypothetical protein